MELYVAALVLVIIGALWVRSNFDRVTVYEYERGLKYVRGRYVGELQPGQYWHYRPTTSIRRVDTRTTFASIGGQELLSSDGVALKLSLAASYEVTDPVAALHKVENFQTALYQELQVTLRDLVGQMKVDEVLEKRHELGTRLLETAIPKTQPFGIKILKVDLKDIMFPGELKKIFAQVVKAQKEGLAALERARGETAALRNLANAARLLEGNPALMHLRLAQLVGESTGNTLILGIPPATTPIPVRGKELEPPASGNPQAD